MKTMIGTFAFPFFRPRSLRLGWAALAAFLQGGCVAATDADVDGPAGAYGEAQGSQGQVRAQENPLAVQTAYTWDGPTIPVCWGSAPATGGGWEQREWVRDAVRKTWERESAVRFVDWKHCPASPLFVGGRYPGISIKTADEWPKTMGLGEQLGYQPDSMRLNFWYRFQRWVQEEWNGGPDVCGSTAEAGTCTCFSAFGEPQACRWREVPFAVCIGHEEMCTRNISVHEFGHALSFVHEQSRSDNNGQCGEFQEGGESLGDHYIGAFDVMSVMSYCNGINTTGSEGILTDTDVLGVRRLYGLPRRDAGFVANMTEYNQDVFVVGTNGKVVDYSWSVDGTFTKWPLPVPAAGFRPNTFVAAISRLPWQVDLFAVDAKGQLVSSWKDPNTGHFSQWYTLSAANVFLPGSHVVAISRERKSMDVFGVGRDGAVKGFWYDSAARSWHGPYNVTQAGSMSATQYAAQLAVVARSPNYMDVFMVGKGGSVLGSSWASDHGSTWSAPSVVAPAGAVHASASIAAVSTHVSKVDAFWVAVDGAIKSASFANGGVPVIRSLTGVGVASPTGGVGAIDREWETVHVFARAGRNAQQVVVVDGQVGATFRGPYYIPVGGAVGRYIVGRSRHAGHLDVFIFGGASGVLSSAPEPVHGAWWDEGTQTTFKTFMLTAP